MNSGPVLQESFSREDRLRKRREFEECYASGKRVSGRLLQLFARERPEQTNSRLGISVGRRVGNAVVRNRLRRRLREIFRQNRPAFSEGPFDVVVQCRASGARASFAQLTADFLDAAKRLRSRTPHRR